MATTRTQGHDEEIFIVATDLDDARRILARHLEIAENDQESRYAEPVYDSEREAENHLPGYDSLGHAVYTATISIKSQDTRPNRR